MIKSMTGYGKAEKESGQKKISVEIRSLNSKQLDVSVKIPSVYRQYEYEIRNEVARRLQRGKIDVFVSYESQGATGNVSINRGAFEEYYAQLSEICKENKIEFGSKTSDSNIVPAILRMPEVVQSEAAAVSDEEGAALMSAAREALDNIDAFRDQEGAILIADLLGRVGMIEVLKEEVSLFEPRRTEAIKARIKEKVDSLGMQIDANRLEQELIFYVEKLDVTEEQVRLSNHCKYFREVVKEESGAGRKLGFIAQEMGREINTMGSKANDADIQRLVVKMKDELEKIKEQLLNLL